MQTTQSEPAPGHGPRPTKRILAGLLVVLVVIIAGATLVFFWPSGHTGSGAAVELISASFGGYPNGTNQTAAEGIFWVQNVGTKPIASLTASMQGLPTLEFGPLEACGQSDQMNSSHPLYPSEIACGRLQATPLGMALANGTSYRIVLHARLLDGTESDVNQSVVFHDPYTSAGRYETPPSGSCGNLGPYLSPGHGPTVSTLSYAIDSATGEATWMVSVANPTPFPLVGLVVGVNNDTLWLSFEFNGSPVSPSNPLPPPGNFTQTFTWSHSFSPSRSVMLVSECADVNGLTSTFSPSG